MNIYGYLCIYIYKYSYFSFSSPFSPRIHQHGEATVAVGDTSLPSAVADGTRWDLRTGPVAMSTTEAGMKCGSMWITFGTGWCPPSYKMYSDVISYKLVYNPH